MSERLSDAADSAEPAPPRQASGDGAPRRPSDEPPADGTPVQSPPATTKPAQSPPAGGPPQRSALSEKARATRPRRTASDVAREVGEKSSRGASTTGSDDGAGAGRGVGRGSDTSADDRAGRIAGRDGGKSSGGRAPERRDSGAAAGDRGSDRHGDSGAAAGDRGSDRRGDSGASAGDRAGKRGPDSAGQRAGRDRAGGKEAPERERPGGPWPMAERSLMATVLGINPALAVGGAAALTAIGVAIDLLRVGTLSTAFTICYLTGCVLATAWARRSGVFWPMVAPPLLMALAVPVVVLVAGTPRPGAGVAQRLLVIGAPLVNGFPIMAWTTGLVLALGLFRLITQRERPERGAARAGGRTSASPRRS